MGDVVWTWADLSAAAGATLDGPPAPLSGPVGKGAVGFSIDTRTLAPGEVFVALTDQRDGHDFVGSAFTSGAAAALVRRDYVRQPGDGALLRVDDPLGALERIAAAARARLAPAARVVAVTGSAGKTTTKEMLRVCFEAVAPGRVHASVKSYNNHWGVPLTLANMPADTRFGVFEIGMNHAGEIRPLTKLVRPHAALITSVLPVHIGNFPDGLDGIARAKAEILEGLGRTGDGIMVAVLPRDSDRFSLVSDLARQAIGVQPDETGHGFGAVSFGASADADVRVVIEDCRFDRNGSDVVIDADGRRHVFRLPLAGRHQAMNAAAVFAVWNEMVASNVRARGADEPWPGIATLLGALARISIAPQGRGQVHSLAGCITLIDESYNANPASVAAALATLGLYDRPVRRVAVLGDMLELGEAAEQLHAGLRDAVLANGIDLVLTCGPLMRHLHDVLPPEIRGAWRPSSAELLTDLLETVVPGDVVTIKGSLGSRMGPLTQALKDRYASAAQAT
ncbi:MAG: UDP-N-acetylmuramoyl-tripeptide--D-alanyl-D-alanine ligase [Hyphomicrobiaceae bacterium]